MPYVSPRQRRFMHARHPRIAEKWDAEIRKSEEAPMVQSRYGNGGSSGRRLELPVEKAYNPEARRQRRLGAAEAGLGLSGGYVGVKGGKGIAQTTRASRKVTGVTGAKDSAESVHMLRNAIRDKAVIVRPKNAAQLAGGALLLGGAGLVRQHAEGKRGRAWN